MSAISVQQLGKQFHLGAQTHTTLRDHLTAFLKRRSGSEKKSFWALKELSFDIDHGEVVGVIGRNGAGKSTLLKILSQITDPTSGEVRIRGRVASLLEVGTGFHPELTGRENVFLNGAILGMSRQEIRRKFDEIVAFSEVEKFLDTPVKHYSSGMSMRLAFAVAAHLEPEILLIDEVLAVGDAAFQKKCLGKMSEVAGQGRTVLFVSHNMTAMSALCQKGIYLERGRLKAVGTIEETINQYVAETTRPESAGFSPQNRTGNGLVRITDLIVGSGEHQHTVVCGKGMTVELSYEAQREGLPIQFQIGVFDSLNSRILALDSLVAPGLPLTYPRAGKVRLDFGPEFSLHPGCYAVNVAACVHRESVDYVQNALTLVVEEGDLFGSGRMPYGKSQVLYKNQWTFLPS